ncbi:Pre-mRNA-splicing regulator female-lethal(2)D [Dissostichus eleginoides]|uniref:Pre-mRNA-splicing regulator female-lethal(2)D n=1 Tax=Dissostichus eleginoides TaxID=100907 RepID=A0AAD9CTV8_DISEL|nr:Pre-mRNA-splicing regulator female-lethal(2)D [Dissostichus eleginoides]
MAAAVSSRNRGAAGGLFFLFTLLCLVCTAASWMDENNLAQRDTDLEIFNGFMSLLEPTMVIMRKVAEGSPKYALSEDYVKSTKDFLEKVKSLIDGDNEGLDAKILKFDQDLRAHKKLVQALEEYHAEL